MIIETEFFDDNGKSLNLENCTARLIIEDENSTLTFEGKIVGNQVTYNYELNKDEKK